MNLRNWQKIAKRFSIEQGTGDLPNHNPYMDRLEGRND